MILSYSSLQPYALIFCGIYCFLIFLTTLQLKFQEQNSKKAICLAEISCVFFLFSDAFAYLYDGQPDLAARWIVIISNFLVFTLIEIQLFFFNLFITYSFMATGRFKKIPKILRVVFILPIVAIILIIISQFTGMFYSFDETNLYHRGPLFIVSFVIPVIIMVVQTVFIIRFRSVLSHKKFLAVSITLLFLICAVIFQLFNTGIAFNDYGALFGCLNMFLLSILDQNDRLLKSSYTDVQTGLPNTYGFINTVEKIRKSGDITKYNSYYFNIVRMGRLNSIYGKEIGDEIITQYGKTLKTKIGREEVIARLGGDFFVALIRCENRDKFLSLLSNVPVTIKIPGKDEETLHISAVTGVAGFETKKIHPGSYISSAAEAMYYAKSVYKKPYVIFDENLKKEIDERKQIEEALSQAIEKEEFLVYYQPKVKANTNQLCGAEALVRWNHNGNVVPPIKFIPILEKNEKICNVDFIVLNQVCCDLRKWIANGFSPIPVSVNFSRRHLGNPNIVEDIISVIEKNNIPKLLIEIEITETIDEYSIEVVKDFVEKLQAKGIHVSIDDFGTGSSSLNLIHQIKFDVLKIDKALVDIENEIGKTLLTRTVELAQLLGMEVIAEGVETLEQVNFLRTINCSQIQGYYYDKPLEKNEFEKRLIKRYY